MARWSIGLLGIVLIGTRVLAHERSVQPHERITPSTTLAEVAERPAGPGRKDEAGRDQRPGEPAAGVTWTEGEIIAAKDQCLRLVAPLRVVIMPQPPIRHGRCGAPAPVMLRSIGAEPELALSPPQPLTCRMVVALHDWAVQVAQPLAKAILGEPIREIAGVSSYQCRDIAGQKGELSEHGLANALDIARFVTASGRVVDVKRTWGPTRRDTVAAAERIEQDAARDKIGRAARRGKAKETQPKASPAADRAFLKQVHAGACRYFATVLGPEANEDHRDHFHFDMGGSPGDICE